MKNYLLALSFLVSISAQAQKFEWAKSCQVSKESYVHKIERDNQQNTLMLGQFNGKMDFDFGPDSFFMYTAGGWATYIQSINAGDSFAWAKMFTANKGGELHYEAMKTDKQGNIYLAGRFSRKVDFDPTNANYYLDGGYFPDFFIQKLRPDGNLAWVRQISARGYNSTTGMEIDDSANIYLSAYFQDSLYIDTGQAKKIYSTPFQQSDILLVKMDSSGRFSQTAVIGGAGKDEVTSMAMNKQAEIYLTGKFNDSIDLDPGIGTKYFGKKNMPGNNFLLKLDQMFNLKWAKVNQAVYLSCKSMAINILNEVLLSGDFQGKIDLDPGVPVISSTSKSLTDIYIIKLDTSGKYLWGRTFSNGSDAGVRKAVFTNDNRVIITGFFGENLNIGTDSIWYFLNTSNQTNYNYWASFITLLDTAGNTLWGGSFYDKKTTIADIIVDTGNSYYIAGHISDTADADLTAGKDFHFASKSYGSFFSKLSATCLPVFGLVSITGCDTVKTNGKIYTNSATSSDHFVSTGGCDSVLNYRITLKYSSSDTMYKFDCDSAIVNNQTYHKSGIYKQILTNAAGCDSFLIIKLYLRQSTTSTINITACDSFISNGVTHFQSGKVTKVIPNSIGCDSVITMNFTIIQKSYDTFSVSGCNVVLVNGINYGQSGIYVQHLTNSVGCDSVLTVLATVHHSIQVFNDYFFCDAITIDGKVYTSTGIYNFYYKTIFGCDSTVTQRLYYKLPTTTQFQGSFCDSAILNGVTYKKSGNYTQYLATRDGCDSIVEMNISIFYNTSHSIKYKGCDSLVINGYTYTTSGIYVQHLTSFVGCDSDLTLICTIGDHSEERYTIKACDSVLVSGARFNSSGMYQLMYKDLNGCDSNLKLNIEISPINSQVTQFGSVLTAVDTNANYQWLDCVNGFIPIAGETNRIFSPQQPGDYAVKLSKSNCTDTSACFTANNIGLRQEQRNPISIYPNPTEGLLNIDFGNSAGHVITVYAATGQLLSVHQFRQKGLASVQMPMCSGIYLLRVQSDSGNSCVFKVVKTD